uniref:Uncharacterized protein n=1 Tax=Strombidium inclinatum TaxID=197538 RepID=A0A7S3IRT6_9SPIT|mmetsp:Transcript_34163/g.52430  ORF Transcript_34163/g.52430 Transcript_34163/m.52430 type:complete len:259 (+) Transcript_34163:129-905(+)
MGSSHHSIAKEGPVVLEFTEADVVFVVVLLRFEVGVSRAVLYRVAHLFTALAPDVLELLGLALFFLLVVLVIVVVFLALVLRELAAGLVLPSLTAAPPHLSSVVALMHAAAPVEVLVLVELFPAVLAKLDPLVNSALAVLEFVVALLHLLAVIDQQFALLLGFDLLVDGHVQFLLGSLCRLLKLGDLFLGLLCQTALLLLQLVAGVYDFFDVFAVRVSLLDQPVYNFLKVLLLALDDIQLLLQSVHLELVLVFQVLGV